MYVRVLLTPIKKSAAFHEQTAAAVSVAQQPSDLQADYLRSLQRKAFPKLSDMELHESSVPVTSIIETFMFQPARTLEHMPSFVQTCMYARKMTYTDVDMNPLQSAQHPCRVEHGMPYVLVLAGNAQRAADIARTLRTLIPGSSAERVKRPRKGKRDDVSSASTSKDEKAAAPAPVPVVAKLFARHFKVEEQDAWLRAQPAPLGVGTPHRVHTLIQQGSCRLDHLAALIIDFSWTDAKQRTVFDTPETRDAMLQLLSDKHVRAAMQRKMPQPACRLALF